MPPNPSCLVNVVPGNHLVLAPDEPRFSIVAVSDDLLAMLGRTRASLLGLGLFEVFRDDQRHPQKQVLARLRASLESVLHSGQPDALEEQRFDLPDLVGGGWIFRVWRPQTRPLFDAQGKVEFLLHSFTDITAEVQAPVVERSNAWKESRNLMQAVVNTSPLGMVLVAAVRDGNGRIEDFRYTWTNTVADGMAGRSPIGCCMLDSYPHVRAIGLFDAYVAALETGQAGEFEEYFEPKDTWLRWLFSPHDDGLFIAVEDITARKRAEQQLKAATGRFEAAIHVSPNVLAILKAVRDAAGNVVDFHFDWVSHSGEAMAGRDVTGERLQQAFPHAGSISLSGRFVRTVETGVPTDYEHHYVGDGHARWIRWKAVRFEDGLFVSVEDITKQKQAVEQARAHEHFISRVTGIIPDMVTVTELPSKRTIYSNRDPLEALGIPAGNLRLLSPADRNVLFQVHPDDATRLRHYYERVNRLPDGEVAAIDYRARYGSFEWRWFSARGSVFERDAQGRVLSMVNVVRDITNERQAEQELQDEHYFLEQVTDNTPQLIYVFDLDEQRFIYINRRIRILTGMEPEYVYGMGPHLFKKVLHPDDLDSYTQYFSKLSTLLPGETREGEFRLLVGRHFRWFRSKNLIFKKEEGRVVQVIGLAEDVTYEKLMHDKVARESGRSGLN